PVERALAETVVDHGPVDQKLAELVGEAVDRVGSVGAVRGHGPLDACAVAALDLRLPITGPEEGDLPLLGVRWVGDSHGVRPAGPRAPGSARWSWCCRGTIRCASPRKSRCSTTSPTGA